MNKREFMEIRELRRYKEKTELSYDLLAKKLNVHISSVVRWLHRGVRPSPIMKRKIIAFLEDEKRKEKEGAK